ncbi:hypothetical protein KKF59_04655 [Patescibacteria group bacterium]|nr:hypothetical protein [Patescibacteria group bacterium]MBU1034721.1 hypothetical protein [Patescibacteria group bacterium]MBU1630024.1 hypothetical protein [Patescibacteria group bacterium]MBU1908384.1 hypothetical protein [Patescibacteria group bacterium]
MPYSEELLQDIIKAQDDFVWEVEAWEKNSRGSRWYLVMSIVVVAFVLYAVVTGNYLFAFIILLSAILIVLAGNEESHTALIQVGRNGIVVDGRLHEYKDLANFSIIYHPPQTKLLYLETGNLIRPRLRISLEEQNPLEIRSHLKQYLNENLLLQEEHISDILARLLKI